MPRRRTTQPSTPEENTACANLGVYIFVGGTGGFDGLENGDQFTELLQTGHVGLYEHANAVVAAEHPPSIIQAIESVFTGTGPGQAELGQVGANYFTLPPSYGYYQAVYIQNGLHPSEANVNTPSDSVSLETIAKGIEALARVRGCGQNCRYRNRRSDRGPQ